MWQEWAGVKVRIEYGMSRRREGVRRVLDLVGVGERGVRRAWYMVGVGGRRAFDEYWI